MARVKKRKHRKAIAGKLLQFLALDPEVLLLNGYWFR